MAGGPCPPAILGRACRGCCQRGKAGSRACEQALPRVSPLEGRSIQAPQRCTMRAPHWTMLRLRAQEGCQVMSSHAHSCGDVMPSRACTRGSHRGSRRSAQPLLTGHLVLFELRIVLLLEALRRKLPHIMSREPFAPEPGTGGGGPYHPKLSKSTFAPEPKFKVQLLLQSPSFISRGAPPPPTSPQILPTVLQSQTPVHVGVGAHQPSFPKSNFWFQGEGGSIHIILLGVTPQHTPTTPSVSACVR